MNQLSREILDRHVAGRHLEGGTMREVLSHGPSLLVFLRHFG
jgi:hypothetical protein